MITTIYQKFIGRYGETFTLVELADGYGNAHTEIVPAARVAKMTEEEFDELFNELLNWENERASWDDNLTYDVVFNNDCNTNNKGFSSEGATYEYCRGYIESYNGTDESYFADYKGGVVSIVCNETGETVYEEEVR